MLARRRIFPFLCREKGGARAGREKSQAPRATPFHHPLPLAACRSSSISTCLFLLSLSQAHQLCVRARVGETKKGGGVTPRTHYTMIDGAAARGEHAHACMIRRGADGQGDGGWISGRARWWCGAVGIIDPPGRSYVVAGARIKASSDGANERNLCWPCPWRHTARAATTNAPALRRPPCTTATFPLGRRGRRRRRATAMQVARWTRTDGGSGASPFAACCVAAWAGSGPRLCSLAAVCAGC